MTDLKEKVAVIGAGCCKFGENYHRRRGHDRRGGVRGLRRRRDRAHADRGGLGRRADLGSIRGGLADALKLFDSPITRVENYCATGTDAFRNACMAVAAGVYDIVLVVGSEKLQGPRRPRRCRASGIRCSRAATPRPGSSRWRATRYMHTFGVGRETLAKVAVKNHHNGARNAEGAPALGDHRRAGAEGADDRVAVRPLRLLPDDRRRRRGDRLPRRPGEAVQEGARSAVKGAASRSRPAGRTSTRRFDYLGFRSTVKAAKPAYDRPACGPKDVDFAEVHDCFTWTEISNIEDLGFCEKGEGGSSWRRRRDRARRRHPDQPERRPQVVRPSDRRDRRAHDLRSEPAPAEQGRRAPGEGRRSRAGPQRRRPGRGRVCNDSIELDFRGRV